MKNLGRIVTAFTVVVGSGASASLSMVGCNGDSTMDGGQDAMNDVMGQDSSPDVAMMDASDASDAGDAPDVDPITAFQQQESITLCKRFQACCNGTDAGLFDYNTCVAQSGAGWHGSNSDITAEVRARGHITLNTTNSASCLAGLMVLSCPDITSTEMAAVTANCYDSVVGTLSNGGNCVDSIECQPGSYCKYAGIDAGTSDAGTKLGQCATLIAKGQPCGQSLPYGDPNEYSTECEYKNWPSSPSSNFCDYDTYPDASGYTCQPLRANSATCYYQEECASGICGTFNQDCINTACTCNTSVDYTPFCKLLAIKDAGTD